MQFDWLPGTFRGLHVIVVIIAGKQQIKRLLPNNFPDVRLLVSVDK